MFQKVSLALVLIPLKPHRAPPSFPLWQFFVNTPVCTMFVDGRVPHPLALSGAHVSPFRCGLEPTHPAPSGPLSHPSPSCPATYLQSKIILDKSYLYGILFRAVAGKNYAGRRATLLAIPPRPPQPELVQHGGAIERTYAPHPDPTPSPFFLKFLIPKGLSSRVCKISHSKGLTQKGRQLPPACATRCHRPYLYLVTSSLLYFTH